MTELFLKLVGVDDPTVYALSVAHLFAQLMDVDPKTIFSGQTESSAPTDL